MFFIGALCGAVITLIVFAGFMVSADSDVRDENLALRARIVTLENRS